MAGLRSLLLPVVLGTSVLAFSCGGTELPGAAPEVRAVTYDGSDWNAGDIAVAVSPAGNGWQVTVDSTAEVPAEDLLLELHFDSGLAATQAQSNCAGGSLNLLVAGRPGIVGLGVLDATLQPGHLLSFELHTADTRQASLAASATLVEDLTVERTADTLSFGWSYSLTGDYNQDSLVSINDLTPLGARLGNSTSDGTEDVEDAIVDGTGDGLITISDLTPIGANFGARVLGYSLLSPDTSTVDDTNFQTLTSVDFAAALTDQPRRRFSLDLTEATQLEREYFYVRANLADTTQGTPSNLVESAPIVAPTFEFAVPPAGETTIDLELATTPSLVLLAGDGTTTEDGAPIVVYTKSGASGNLYLAYYLDGAWHSERVGTETYSNPRVVVAGDQRLVIAQDVAAGKVVALSFDAHWDLQGSADVATAPGALSQIDVDVDGAGTIGVALGYITGSGFEIEYATNAGGTFAEESVTTGTDTLAGLTFRYDPNGGDPWLLYSHGTVDTSSTFVMSFDLEMARRSGTWNVSTVAHPNSPLDLDLDFKADGTPQLALTAGRDWTLPLPGNPFTATIQFDGQVGTWDGTQWSFANYYTSSVGIEIGIGFPPEEITLTPRLTLETGWARQGEIGYNVTSGSILVDLDPLLPQSATLTNVGQYAAFDGAVWLEDTGYYDGTAGAQYSWAERGSVHGTAFVRFESLSSDDLLNGNFQLENELRFWRK